MCLLAVQVVADSTADLRKVQAMNLGRLGAALAGGATKARPKAAMGNPDGFLIPERFKQQLGRFDKDDNGRLSPRRGRRHARRPQAEGPPGRREAAMIALVCRALQAWVAGVYGTP